MPPLGAHVSVAGGVHTAPERGKRIGAEVIQIFSKHGTRWTGKALGEDDIRAFREESARTGVRTVAIHCAYLINLGSSKETVRTRSLYALEDEAFAADRSARYLWWYRRTPYFDREQGVLPVYRLPVPPPAGWPGGGAACGAARPAPVPPSSVPPASR